MSWYGRGLPHDFRDGDVYIMGNGFRRLRDFISQRKTAFQRVDFSRENAFLRPIIA